MHALTSTAQMVGVTFTRQATELPMHWRTVAGKPALPPLLAARRAWPPSPARTTGRSAPPDARAAQPHARHAARAAAHGAVRPAGLRTPPTAPGRALPSPREPQGNLRQCIPQPRSAARAAQRARAPDLLTGQTHTSRCQQPMWAAASLAAQRWLHMMFDTRSTHACCDLASTPSNTSPSCTCTPPSSKCLRGLQQSTRGARQRSRRGAPRCERGAAAPECSHAGSALCKPCFARLQHRQVSPSFS